MSLLPSSCAEMFRNVNTCLNCLDFFGWFGNSLFESWLALQKYSCCCSMVRTTPIRCLVVHPSTTIHTQLNDDEKIATGITPDLVRVSVVIEHIDDIIADFDKAISSIDF
ncbi:Protein MET17 [Smittium culicis]|uniref:Protein MET17 n=1 Tax=Smittium culicis TaxID=133412 RepID=A0A1R1X5B1_9FUNG|nr:Protein MET17 [Smittium culicis]